MHHIAEHFGISTKSYLCNLQKVTNDMAMALNIDSDTILFVLDPSTAFDEVTIMFQSCESSSE